MPRDRITKAVFIERDGILNEIPASSKKTKRPPLFVTEFKVIESARPEIARLKKAGFLIIVTTHQPGLSKRKLEVRELQRMHSIIGTYFDTDDILVCPHDAEHECQCKKPKPGLILDAQQKHEIHLPFSCVLSDDWRDDTVARSTGCYSVQIRSPYNNPQVNDFTAAPDLSQAVSRILKFDQRKLSTLN